MTPALESLLGTFGQRLFMPQPDPLLAVLGVVAANRLKGDPVWLMLVGSPGNLKTELLLTAMDLEGIHPVGTLSEAGLLSGSSARDRGKDATGGLLREIGEQGIILCKDFTTILSGQREKRQQVLAALREVYDGSWTRTVGTDGGFSLTWKGKVGFLGGVTPIVDTHQSFMSSMGERFLLLRMPELNEEEQARAALGHSATGNAMREELSAAVSEFFRGLDLQGQGEQLTEEWKGFLTSLAVLVARGRSAVVRDGKSRQIELVMPPEAPTRIAIVLDRFRAGLAAIGVDEVTTARLLRRVGLDCLPVVRGRILSTSAAKPCAVFNVNELARAVGHPLGTTRRQLEDLEQVDLVERASAGAGKADSWRLSKLAQKHLRNIEGFKDADTPRNAPGVPDEFPPDIGKAFSDVSA